VSSNNWHLAEGDIVNCESVPGKTGSLSISSYSPHSMMAIHYVPLRPPGMIGQPSSRLCPPRAGGSASPPPRSRPRFPVQNLGRLFCVYSLPGGARVARPLRGQVVLFLLMRRELGLVAGGSSSVHNCSCATFSPFSICTRDRSRMARSRGE